MKIKFANHVTDSANAFVTFHIRNPTVNFKFLKQYMNFQVICYLRNALYNIFRNRH